MWPTRHKLQPRPFNENTRSRASVLPSMQCMGDEFDEREREREARPDSRHPNHPMLLPPSNALFRPDKYWLSWLSLPDKTMLHPSNRRIIRRSVRQLCSLLAVKQWIETFRSSGSAASALPLISPSQSVWVPSKLRCSNTTKCREILFIPKMENPTAVLLVFFIAING